MKIYKYDGLLCTDISITFGEKTKVLNNIVIDTGAVQSIINSLVVEDLDIVPRFLDELSTTIGIGGEMSFFSKLIDEVKISDKVFKSIEMDFGEIDSKGEIMGLIGLDILEKLRAVIDIEISNIYYKV